MTSLASAIEGATGLVAGKDFELLDVGSGPFISKWDEINGPQPDRNLLDQWLIDDAAKQPARDLRAVVTSVKKDYIEALIYRDELGDNTLMLAIQAKLAAAKTEADSKVVTP